MQASDIKFSVRNSRYRIPASARLEAFLIEDNWDDFGFSTLFHLTIVDDSGVQHEIGAVKIGRLGMGPKRKTPKPPKTFRQLDQRFFSLGQSDNYYSNLRELGAHVSTHLLHCLRDIAESADLFDRVQEERVTQSSLLRSVSANSVTIQYRRIAHGGARLSPFGFSYDPLQKTKGARARSLTFEVDPNSSPPTNIHVLVGRNGVGKSFLLQRMIAALTLGSQYGKFSDARFSNLVSVTFSAFDNFESSWAIDQHRDVKMRYAYVGLRRPPETEGGHGLPKSPEMLADEFVASLANCLRDERRIRWQRAIDLLASDPIFADEAVRLSSTKKADKALERRARSVFDGLSSGHKIVLLSLTGLVESVEERSLVLIDEPEAHLHPPLLSAFVRALSDLLVNRNGVAVVATHSPVVLQEVPKSCVWKIRRSTFSNPERPEIETFGENVGILTREVFGLEVTETGFHRMLRRAATSPEATYESVLESFGGHLGGEARALVRSLVASRT